MRNKYVGEDVRQRLGGTVIRYRQRPYYCIVEAGVIHLQDMVTRRVEHRVSHDDPELDISSLDLGYINVVSPLRCAVYASRVGHRRYKQGVDLNNLTYSVLAPAKERVGFAGDYLFCQGFVDAYEGKFPSLKEAIKLIGSGYSSVALSQEVAIMRDIDLFKVYIKNEEVGWMKAGTTTVNIPKTETSWMYQYYLDSIEGWSVVEGVK